MINYFHTQYQHLNLCYFLLFDENVKEFAMIETPTHATSKNFNGV